MKSTEQTRALAQQVLDFIHDNPERHDQESWNDGPLDQNGCGTAMCIAGTANALFHGVDAINYIAGVEAVKLLGLDHEASVIFYEMDNDRAIQKLKKIIVGEEFSKEDFYTDEDGDGDLIFNDHAWALYSKERGF
jgi:hypothetical protein